MTRTVRISNELFDKIATQTPENLPFSQRADLFFELQDDDIYLTRAEIRELIHEELEQYGR